MSGLSVSRPLTSDEEDHFFSTLTTWLSPSDFKNQYTQAQNVLGYEYMMLMHRAFIRDAHIACEVAEHFSASKVRLLANDPPDFEIEVDRNIHRFEVTEALNPKRQRDKEMRKRLSLDFVEMSESIPNSKIVEENRGAIEAVVDVTTKKFEKYKKRNLKPNFDLLVYKNVGWSGEEEEKQFFSEIKTRLEEPIQFFPTIWIYNCTGRIRAI